MRSFTRVRHSISLLITIKIVRTFYEKQPFSIGKLYISFDNSVALDEGQWHVIGSSNVEVKVKTNRKSVECPKMWYV